MLLNIKKNKENLAAGKGYAYFLKKSDGKLYVWEYEIKKEKKDDINHKTFINLIFEGEKSGLTISSIINTFSTWNQLEGYTSLPIFEVKSAQEFPMEATFIPMFKRKIMTYIFQVVNMEVLKNFDSDVQI
mgnify:FL=1